MNEDWHNEPQAALDPELEVRLTALALGEASDFERDQLEQLIRERAEVAAAYERLHKLHGCLTEVGAGELVGTDGDWKLSTARRNKLLAAFSGEGIAGDAAEPVFVSKHEHRKWSTLFWSKSFVSAAAVVCVIGIVWGLSLPAVQMARESSRAAASAQLAESARELAEAEAVADGLMRGGTTATFKFEGVASTPAIAGNPVEGRSNSANAVNSASEASTAAMVELQQTLSADLPTPYYLNDDVQYFSTPSTALPPQSMLSKNPTLARGSSAGSVEHGFDVTDFESTDFSEGGPGSASGMAADSGMGGYGGGMGGGSVQSGADGYGLVDNMLDVEASAEPGGVVGGLAAPVPPTGAAEVAQSGAVPFSPTPSTWAALPNAESESPSRGEQLARPRIIITDEEPAVTTDQKPASGVDSLSTVLSEDVFLRQSRPGRDKAVEGFREPTDAPQSESDEQVYSFGIPFVERGKKGQSTLDENAPVAPEGEAREFGEFAGRSFGRASQLDSLGEVGDALIEEKAIAQSRMDLALGIDDQQQAFANRFGNGSPEFWFDGRAGNQASQQQGSQQQGRTSGVAEKYLKRNAGSDFAAGQSFETQGLDEKLAEDLMGEESTVMPTRPAELRKALPEGLDELSAAKEAFSTFSLHVSDVSFKLALAALSQGEWPDASKIRVEEFVNAFDYRDPLPTTAEKVTCQMEQAIHPFLMQRNLLRVSMRTAATGRSGSTPLRLTLLLDNSGSMERNDRRQTLRRAFEALIQQLKPGDQVTLISFANRPRLLADRIRGDKASQLLSIIETLPSEGGTNIEAALQLAMEKATEQLDPTAEHRIVLLTDGAVNLGDANPDALSRMVTRMRDAGIAFDAAGISARDLNDEVLEALTRQGDGRYYLLDAAEAVGDGFADQIAGALRPSAKNVKVQIEFNPQRVGQYKLLGFEKHRLQTEDFRNDQIDAAELAAAEAGVAVYQFEAKPDGTGDIGSVSVRFRDLKTGEMVERTWPIPYLSHPPRIEEASPSLRIAATAAFLAAKLRGEAMGALVSLQSLAAWIAELPAADRTQARVQQLQSMIAIARQMESSRQ
jgi:Mg-chelatase subunit ChlD